MPSPYQTDKVYCAKMIQKWRFIQEHHPDRAEQAEAALVELTSAAKVVPTSTRGQGGATN